MAFLGLHTNWINSSRKTAYDVVVCNPPYLPILKGFEDLAPESTVAGTDLLSWVICHGRSLGVRVYIQFSDLAESEAQEAEKISGAKLIPVGEQQIVPFRVRIALERPNYMKAFVGRGLIHQEDSPYRYWHRIRTYRIEY